MNMEREKKHQTARVSRSRLNAPLRSQTAPSSPDKKEEEEEEQTELLALNSTNTRRNDETDTHLHDLAFADLAERHLVQIDLQCVRVSPPPPPRDRNQSSQNVTNIHRNRSTATISDTKSERNRQTDLHAFERLLHHRLVEDQRQQRAQFGVEHRHLLRAIIDCIIWSE
jgi:hypothetical protein